jgi:chromosome segregation ATPase
MATDTKSSLFRGMAVLLARIRTQERHLERLRAELAFVSFSAEQGYASAVACRNELRSSIADVEARLDTLRAALEEGDRKAAEVRQRTVQPGEQRHG